MVELNFWEDLAFNWKKRAKNDFNQIDTVKRTLEKNRSSELVDLAPEIQKLAAFREDINQAEDVRFILRNQRSGIGTLLNLPTGFGKTFIIFMAAAQQIKSIPKEHKKPYLVIAPAVNVIESWKANHKLLTEDLGVRGDPIFSEGASLVAFKTAKEFFNAYNKSECRQYDFIVMTAILLKSIVDNLLCFKKSDFSGKDCSLLRCSGILSHDNLILGDQSFWELRILEVFTSWKQSRKNLLDLFKKVTGDVDDLQYNSRRIKPDERQFDEMRKNFISDFESFGKENANDIARLLVDFLPKISFFDEEAKRCIDSEKLFDYCYCFSSFQEEFDQSQKEEDAFLKDLWDNLSPILVRTSKEQKESLQKYDRFKSNFNGLILDESDQILVTNGASEQTDIILDIAKTFQTRSEKDNPQNPLLIASSATPWPNAMNEFKLHLKVLLPKLLGQYRDLHDDLFGKWNSFEVTFDKMYPFKSSIATNADQSDEQTPPSKKSPQKSNNSLADSLYTVQTYFYQWIRLLFEQTVSYEKPVVGKTNDSTEEVLYISGDKSYHKPAGKEILTLIHNFYSDVLQSDLSRQQGGMLSQIFELLNKEDQFAFFVELEKDAAFLAMEISDYYEKKFNEQVQIGLFYNEAFVKKQKGIKEKYLNVTFNTDRMVSINSFNNIFRFEDFYKYLNQYFGTSKITENKGNIESLVIVIQSILEKKKLPASKKVNRKNTNSLIKMRECIEKNTKDPSSNLSKVELKLYQIFTKLIELEKKSSAQIILDFSKELEIFKSCIGRKYQKMETVKAFTTYSVEAKKMINERKNNEEVDLIKDLQRVIFHYLNKIYQSKILIFGNAGTSGMRIDADRLTVLSGAWTEGKMSQIKGRVGRLKGAGNSRKCKIYLPITSTLFEFFILRYYIKKALYDLFITSKERIEMKSLCQQLLLSGSLIDYYKRCDLKGEDGISFLDPSIHQIIKERISLSQEYLTLGAYEKALKIIPQSIRDEMQKFEQEILLEVERKLQQIQPEHSSSFVEEMILDTPELAIRLEEESAGRLDALISNVEMNESNSSEKSTPPPRIQPALNAAWSFEELEEVKKQVIRSRKEKVIIFLVPTRGEHPDIPLEEFSGYISTSIEKNCYPIVIYGVNHPEGVERKIERSLSESSSLFAKITAFTWFEEDRRDKVPPIGQMRNFCLEQAKTLWQALTKGDTPVKQQEEIYLCSMDGDTELTPKSFQRVMAKVDHHSRPPFGIATGGYDFASEASEWSKRSNRISMEINSGCQTEVDSLDSYYGYLAEPLIAISPSLVKQLFEQERKNSFFQMKNEEMAPFGFWNFEGRRLHRYLNILVKGKLNSFGPPSNNKEMPILKNYERFFVEKPPFILKVRLSKENLAAVITRLFNQSQHSIQPSFMASNIAYHLLQNANPVRRFAAYFYANNVLKLLNLGPERGWLLTKKISNFYRNQPIEYNKEDTEKFGVNKGEFILFIKNNFGEEQVVDSTNKDVADKDALEKARKDFNKSALLLAFWARNVFSALWKEFGKTYEEELDSEGNYISMAMPENYPKQAESGLSQDEELLIIDADEQLPKNQLTNSLAKVVHVSFDNIEKNLAKKHILVPIDMQAPICKETLKCYPAIQKIIFIARHNLFILFLNQPFQNVNEQKELCQKTLEKVKEVCGSNRELAISLHQSDKGSEVRFAELNQGNLSYTNHWKNDSGLIFEEKELKTW